MGRHKVYNTPNAFYKAVKLYFDSISNTVVRDEVNALGTYVMETVYFVPPSVTDLCFFLKISPQTWSNYSSGDYGEEYAEICAEAKNRVKSYLEKELLTRTKGIEGVKFALQNCFGQKEKKEVSVDADTLKIISESSLTVEDKLNFIKQFSKESLMPDAPAEVDENKDS